MTSLPPRSRASRGLSIGALVLAGCSGAAPAAPPRTTPVVAIPAPTVADPAPRLDPAVLSVTTVAPPKAFVLDGDVQEWGSLLPVSRLRAAGAPAPLGPRSTEPAEGQPPPPPPRPAALPPAIAQAASHLAVALAGDAVLVAADLDGTAAESVWLGLGTTPPELPFPGVVGPWGNGFQELVCSEVVMENCDGYPCPGKDPTPPDELAKCKKQLADYEAFAAAQRGRFRKVFRIDKEGVKVVSEGGQLTPVLGAKVAWKSGAQKTSVEVSMPQLAMPRVAEAPLATLHLVARLASSPVAPILPEDAWLESHLPAIVSFEPYGDVRAAIWAVALDNINSSPTGMTRLRPPPGLSYQPGNGVAVEGIEASEVDAKVVEGTLFTTAAKLGEVEVGAAHIPRDFLVILKSGKLVGVVDAEDGVARGVLVRNKEIHVVRSTERPWSSGWYETLPFWSVVVVDAAGKYREAIVPPESPYDGGHCNRFGDREVIADKKLERFGFTGKCLDALGNGEEIEIVHRWDDRKKVYSVGAWSPKKAAKTPAKKK